MNIIEQSSSNYINQFKKLSDDWFALQEYIRPLIMDTKIKELMTNINVSMVTLPLAHLVINQSILIQLDTMKAMLPPMKIECPDCKKVIWDISELKEFLEK